MSFYLKPEYAGTAYRPSERTPENAYPRKSLQERGRRFYSPNQSRWLNRDPIGEDGGINLFILAANTPILRIDVVGLCDLSCCENACPKTHPRTHLALKRDDSRYCSGRKPMVRCYYPASKGSAFEMWCTINCKTKKGCGMPGQGDPDYAEWRQSLCCTRSKINQSRTKLTSKYHNAWRAWQRLGVKPDDLIPTPQGDEGPHASCKNSSADTLKYMDPTPPCWRCRTEARWKSVLGGVARADHQVIVCTSLPEDDSPQEHIVYDWWKQKRQPYLYLQFVAEWPNPGANPSGQGAIPITGAETDCETGAILGKDWPPKYLK